MAKELLKRSEVEPSFTWNLADMYITPAAWEEEIQLIIEYADKLAKKEGMVTATAADLYETLSTQMIMEEKVDLAYNYAARLADEDTGNSTHQAMLMKLRTIIAGISTTLAFIEPEILETPEEVLERYYSELPDLEFYRKHIVEIQRLKAHSLSADMEKFLAMTNEMSGTAAQTFAVFNNADLKFPEVTDENGDLVRITHGRFAGLEESTDRSVRKATFEKLYHTYQQYENTLASLYNGQVKQLIFKAKARLYPSTLEASVNANNVSPKVYENLLTVVNHNLDKMHRYVRLRKKLLSVDELHMYDIYVPMIADASRKVTFDEAKETVLKALSPLGEDYISILKEGFENRWIDVYENEGKRSGAYSAGAYGTHPYVLLNHDNSLGSMFTLAHEMGHAIHSYLSNKTQPYIYAGYKIFVAEVASTCNEILLMEYLLKHTTDVKERIYLLNHYLDKFKGTVYRQTMFAEFEKQTNAMAEAGESLTAKVLSKIYHDLNCKYYGPDMVSDPEIAVEWARIPHFYYNFYVYQYATGFSAAVAIAQNILANGAPAVEKYKEFLSGGCSQDPVSLLKIAGVDLETPKPIQDALDVFGNILDEIDQLTNS